MSDKMHQPSTDYIAIDTETYYDDECSVSKLGSHAYTKHPNFQTLLISAATPDGSVICEPPETFPWEVLKGRKIIAHNAGFDRAVLRATPGCPRIPDDAWIDTSGMCAYNQLPRSLKGACEVLFDCKVSKDVRDRMKGRTLEDLSQNERAEFVQYAKDDAKYALRIYKKLLPKTPQHEMDLMTLAMNQGEYGVRIDRQALELGIDSLVKARGGLIEQLPWFPDMSPGSKKGLERACEDLGIPAPSSTKKEDPKLKAWMEDYPGGADLIERLQHYRKIDRTLKLLRKIEERLTTENILPFEVKYYGSEITGRFSGAGRLNMLNLPKAPVEGVDIRGLIIPRAGHKLAVIDLSNIEVRTGAMLVGDTKMLKSIQEGVDVYEAHARASMGWNGGDLKAEDPATRDLAKVRVLALGFQQGSKRLSEGKGLGLKRAEQIVREFRRTNPKITARWRDLEVGLKHNHGPGTRDYVNTLPSGRELRYHNVKREQIKAKLQCTASPTKGGDGRREAYYGGRLYENECQALARDIFCHGLLAVQRAGIRVLFTVHDELVAEAPSEDAEATLQQIIKLMTTPPLWAEDLPLGAEGHLCSEYTKI
ncbi:DNA polymerase [Verrucomicrobia bacterium]|nr:DNA polymerase [Verrucomicrobiota bacterium]